MGLCIATAVASAVFFYLLAACSWIVGATGYALYVEGNVSVKAQYLNFEFYPYWMFAVGTPVALIISGVHIIMLACQVQKKFAWILCSLPVVLMPTYVFFATGAMITIDHRMFHSAVNGGASSLTNEHIYVILRFAGALGTTVFLMLAMMCEFCAIPFVFSSQGSRNQVVDSSFTRGTVSSLGPVSWSAKLTKHSSSGSATSLIQDDKGKGKDHADQPNETDGDGPRETNVEMDNRDKTEGETRDRPSEDTTL